MTIKYISRCCPVFEGLGLQSLQLRTLAQIMRNKCLLKSQAECWRFSPSPPALLMATRMIWWPSGPRTLPDTPLALGLGALIFPGRLWTEPELFVLRGRHTFEINHFNYRTSTGDILSCVEHFFPDDIFRADFLLVGNSLTFAGTLVLD